MSSPTPPTDTPIIFLAGEFGCSPRWYPGFCWQSSASNQPLKFYVYPWHMGFDRKNPPFNAPPYLGEWHTITNKAVLDFIKDPQR